MKKLQKTIGLVTWNITFHHLFLHARNLLLLNMSLLSLQKIKGKIR